MTVTDRPPVAHERAVWRAVALPSEHGGWGLTLEPVLLGLLVSPSWAGLALGCAALLAFLVRTPLKIALGDARRGRWLTRSRVAAMCALGELAAIGALGWAAAGSVGWRWWWPLACAAPLVAVELWFDVRSRGRRLVPELCGAAGITSVAAAICLAGGSSARLALAMWLVLAARGVGAIPFVRAQIMRLRRGSGPVAVSDAAQLVAVVVAAAGVALSGRAAAGAVAVAVLGALQVRWVRQPPIPAKRTGIRQMVLGFALVAITAIGAVV